MSIANYLEDKIMNLVFKGVAYTPPATVYASLHTADPTETGATSEVTGGSYARQAVTFGTVSGGAVSNSAALNFTGMPVSTITHVGLFDALTAGNALWNGAAATSKTMGAGDTYQIAVDDMSIALD